MFTQNNLFFSLKSIDFGYNRIDYMTKQFLQAIPHVESLNMESNLLKNLKKETFFPTRKIIKLNLNGNKIQGWFLRLLHRPTHLSTVYISHII